MKNFLILALVMMGLGLFVSGCATTGANSPNGLALVKMDQEPAMVTDNRGNLVGTACAQNILGIAATGDASIEAAKRNGGITRVSSVDYDFENILLVYGKVCTIVHGS